MSFPDYEPFTDTGESFVGPLHDIYSRLKIIYDTKGGMSEEVALVVFELASHIKDFWVQDSNHNKSTHGSFGANQEGEDQIAMCWNVQRKDETSICKWGLVNFDGEEIPKIKILAIDFSQGLNYSIETENNCLFLRRSNGSKTIMEQMIIPFRAISLLS